MGELQRNPGQTEGEITSTVVQEKKISLRSIYSVRQWLAGLKTSTALPDETVKQNIQLEYRKFTNVAFVDWPSGGPTAWLSKWEELINRADQYEDPLPTWLRDICLVWERVSALNVFFTNVQIDIQQNTATNYTPDSVRGSITRFWEHKKQGLSLRVAGRPKATRSAFTTQKVTFDGEEAPETAATTAVDAPALTRKMTLAQRKKRSKSRPRTGRGDRSRNA